MRAITADISSHEISAIGDADSFGPLPVNLRLITENEWEADPLPGQLWAGNIPATFYTPVLPVPAEITRRQARLALLFAGKLDAVDAAIASIADPMARAVAQIEWNEALTIDRASPLITELAPALGLSEADIDNLFIQGAGL